MRINARKIPGIRTQKLPNREDISHEKQNFERRICRSRNKN
jgi:hypothetical protein